MARKIQWYSVLLFHTGLLCGILGFAWFGGTVAAREKRERFTEIDVERINVVEADGSVKMVISNKERLPEPGGQTQRTDRSPGILFYNDEGDECGGLRYASRKIEGRMAAGASLMFDQYKEDRTIGLAYEELDGYRKAGLEVWDRNGSNSSTPRATRLFAGKTHDRTARVALSDAAGKPRLVLSVSPEGHAKIEFLDETGRVTAALPRATADLKDKPALSK